MSSKPKKVYWIFLNTIYIPATPDSFMRCKQHGFKKMVEIEDGLKYCQFLTKASSGNITMNTYFLREKIEEKVKKYRNVF